MTASATLTVRLSQTMKDQLGRLAESTDRTRSYLAGEAIASDVARELEIIGPIQRGLDDRHAGRLVAHEDVMTGLEKIIAPVARGARCSGMVYGPRLPSPISTRPSPKSPPEIQRQEVRADAKRGIHPTSP